MGDKGKKKLGYKICRRMSELLDTNIFVDYFRGQVKAKRFLREQAELKCSVVTAAELLQGSRNKREQMINQRLLLKIEILPITVAISGIMLSLIEKYALSRGLEIADSLIAATAMEENLTLVTANVKHFSFIKGLKLKKWQAVFLRGVGG